MVHVYVTSRVCVYGTRPAGYVGMGPDQQGMCVWDQTSRVWGGGTAGYDSTGYITVG